MSTRVDAPAASSGRPVVAPVVTAEVVRDYAERAGVCVRPLLRQVTDRETGHRTSVVLRCGSTRESKCPPVRSEGSSVADAAVRRGLAPRRRPPRPPRATAL